MKHCTLCNVSWLLVIIGGINWGLVGLGTFLEMNLNVVNLLLGAWPVVEAIVYILVGLAAVNKGLHLCKCSKK